MYDPHEVLRLISDRPVPVLLFGGIAIVANLVFYVETLRAADRDACVPMTVLAIATFLPHDGNYVLNAHKWFSTYDHWFPILFWFALIITSGFALLFLRQIVRYGPEELDVPARLWTPGVLACVACGCVLWGVVKANLDDDLYLLSFMITIAWCAVSGAALLVRRGSARGQTVRQWQAFTVMGGGFFVCSQFLGSGFHGLGWYALSAVSVLSGVAMTVAVGRLAGDRLQARGDVLVPRGAGVGVTPR